MPTKYIVLVASGIEKHNIIVKILTSKIIELEKLQEIRMSAVKTAGIQQWNRALWSQQKNPEKKVSLVIMFCGF
jgi:hypothetical protein